MTLPCDINERSAAHGGHQQMEVMTMTKNTELELRPLDQNTDTRELTAEELEHVNGGSRGSDVGAMVGWQIAGPVGEYLGSGLGALLG
jgi:hypothetical protein